MPHKLLNICVMGVGVVILIALVSELSLRSITGDGVTLRMIQSPPSRVTRGSTVTCTFYVKNLNPYRVSVRIQGGCSCLAGAERPLVVDPLQTAKLEVSIRTATFAAVQQAVPLDLEIRDGSASSVHRTYSRFQVDEPGAR
jgi:hypothetical protein